MGQNLNFTKDNCNGIESYCLYLVLSVCDYYLATNDTVTTSFLAAHVTPKLEHAQALWSNPKHLGFVRARARESFLLLCPSHPPPPLFLPLS